MANEATEKRDKFQREVERNASLAALVVMSIPGDRVGRGSKYTPSRSRLTVASAHYDVLSKVRDLANNVYHVCYVKQLNDTTLDIMFW